MAIPRKKTGSRGPYAAAFLAGMFVLPAVAQELTQEERIESLRQQVERLEESQKDNLKLLGGLIKPDNNPINFNGFFSVGLSRLSESGLDISYDTGQGSDLSLLPTSYAGIQMNTSLYDGGEFVYQVVAKGNDDNKNTFGLQTEWLYLKQDLGAGFNLQVGRIRFPAFMDSENYYIGTTYPWVTPPNEVYEVLPITNIDGISVNHMAMAGDWLLGTKILLWGDSRQGSMASELHLDDVYGLAFSAASDNLNLRIAYMAAEEKIVIDSEPTGILLDPLQETFGDDLQYLILSARYDNGTLYASFEGVEIDADKGVLDENRNWNTTLGAHFGPVLVYLGYSETRVTNDDEIADAVNDEFNGQTINTMYGPLPLGTIFAPYLNRQQHTKTVGLKYDFSPRTALKVQVQYLDDFDGTSGNFVAGSQLPFEDVYIYDIAIQGNF